MSYEVKALLKFDSELKRLTKKFPSLKAEYISLVNSLKLDPMQGISLGRNCRKIRLSISSKGKGKGKSGGARIITCVQVYETTVYLLAIFDKSDQENISDTDLKELLKWI